MHETYILKDPNSGAHPTEFENPINLGRLVSVHLWHLKDFSESGRDRQVDIRQADGQTMRRATVLAHGYQGALRVRWEDNQSEDWVNLPREEYSWVI